MTRWAPLVGGHWGRKAEALETAAKAQFLEHHSPSSQGPSGTPGMDVRPRRWTSQAVMLDDRHTCLSLLRSRGLYLWFRSGLSPRGACR